MGSLIKVIKTPAIAAVGMDEIAIFTKRKKIKVPILAYIFIIEIECISNNNAKDTVTTHAEKTISDRLNDII